MLVCWKFKLNLLYNFCDGATFQVVCQEPLSDFMKSMTSAEFHLDCYWIQKNVCAAQSLGSKVCLMFILKGCQFRPFLLILLKGDLRISGTLFLRAEAFGFVGELRSRLLCSCCSWSTARFLRFILVSLIHLILSHIIVNAGTVRNSAVWKMHSKLLLSTLNTSPLQVCSSHKCMLLQHYYLTIFTFWHHRRPWYSLTHFWRLSYQDWLWFVTYNMTMNWNRDFVNSPLLLVDG